MNSNGVQQNGTEGNANNNCSIRYETYTRETLHSVNDTGENAGDDQWR
jgi:hypothetical protein